MQNITKKTFPFLDLPKAVHLRRYSKTRRSTQWLLLLLCGHSRGGDHRHSQQQQCPPRQQRSPPPPAWFRIGERHQSEPSCGSHSEGHHRHHQERDLCYDGESSDINKCMCGNGVHNEQGENLSLGSPSAYLGTFVLATFTNIFKGTFSWTQWTIIFHKYRLNRCRWATVTSCLCIAVLRICLSAARSIYTYGSRHIAFSFCFCRNNNDKHNNNNSANPLTSRRKDGGKNSPITPNEV